MFIGWFSTRVVFLVLIVLNKKMIALERNSFEPFRIKVGNVQMVCLAIDIKILKHSAYQNLVNQELPMAAMLLMDKDHIRTSNMGLQLF
jgi:hypothetical protein